MTIGPYSIRLSAMMFMECLEEALIGTAGAVCLLSHDDTRCEVFHADVPRIAADSKFLGGACHSLTVSVPFSRMIYRIHLNCFAGAGYRVQPGTIRKFG